MINKEKLISINDSDVKIVDVKEWNDTVGIKTLSGKEWLEFFTKFQALDGSEDSIAMRNWLLLKTLCTEDGARIFSDDESDLVERKNGKVLTKLFNIALEHNIITDQKIEDATKN